VIACMSVMIPRYDILIMSDTVLVVLSVGDTSIRGLLPLAAWKHHLEL
jgi:hypothetical protein